MSTFTSKSVELAGQLRIRGPADQVFELFSPLGEKLWVPNWDPELLHPAGVPWAAGLVFRTRAETGDAIWIVTRLDRSAHEVEYHRVEPDRYVARILVRCTTVAETATDVSTSYEFIGLSDRGNAEIAAMSQDAYMKKLAQWSQWIDEHLARAR